MDARPDEEDRTATAIDAIAGSLAIEHTSVDTVVGQRRESARFMEVIGDLEAEVGRQLGFRLSITFPYDGVNTGQNWSGMRAGLRQWLVNESASLPEGEHSIQLPEFLFAFHVSKATGRTPGLFFRRYEPEEPGFAERLRVQIERKAAKLGPHRSAGRTTVLIVESDDIALMNRAKLERAILIGFPNGLPEQVDELWYADTSVPGEPPQFFELVARRSPTPNRVV